MHLFYGGGGGGGTSVTPPPPPLHVTPPVPNNQMEKRLHAIARERERETYRRSPSLLLPLLDILPVALVFLNTITKCISTQFKPRSPVGYSPVRLQTMTRQTLLYFFLPILSLVRPNGRLHRTEKSM